jgi:DNA-binding response OmpR family regulator
MTATASSETARASGDGRLRALVVDDEEPLARLVASYLEAASFDVEVVFDGPAAVEAAQSESFDVIVLDVMLPGIDGIEVCRRIRTFSDAYVLMLTARAEELDTLIGLSVGADDYVTKPFSPRELVARIQALLRRPRTAAGSLRGTSVLRVGDVVLDRDAHEARRSEEVLELTPLEFELLVALAEQPNVAFTRRQLLDRVWGDSWIGDEHVVDVHVANLRTKLGDDPRSGRYVRTVRGVGYRIGSGR